MIRRLLHSSHNLNRLLQLNQWWRTNNSSCLFLFPDSHDILPSIISLTLIHCLLFTFSYWNTSTWITKETEAHCCCLVSQPWWATLSYLLSEHCSLSLTTDKLSSLRLWTIKANGYLGVRHFLWICFTLSITHNKWGLSVFCLLLGSKRHCFWLKISTTYELNRLLSAFFWTLDGDLNL